MNNTVVSVDRWLQEDLLLVHRSGLELQDIIMPSAHSVFAFSMGEEIFAFQCSVSRKTNCYEGWSCFHVDIRHPAVICAGVSFLHMRTLCTLVVRDAA